MPLLIETLGGVLLEELDEDLRLSHAVLDSSDFFAELLLELPKIEDFGLEGFTDGLGEAFGVWGLIEGFGDGLGRGVEDLDGELREGDDFALCEYPDASIEHRMRTDRIKIFLNIFNFPFCDLFYLIDTFRCIFIFVFLDEM